MQTVTRCGYGRRLSGDLPLHLLNSQRPSEVPLDAIFLSRELAGVAHYFNLFRGFHDLWWCVVSWIDANALPTVAESCILGT